MNIIEKLLKLIGNISALIMLFMMVVVLGNVIARYFFNTGSIAFQEIEWHLFAVMFLLGLSYALQEESHVRVDFLYEKFSKKRKALINIIGTIVFLIPFSILIIYTSYEFVLDSYNIAEISEDPGGLTHRWIIKFMIPLSFLMLIISSFGYILKNIKIMKSKED